MEKKKSFILALLVISIAACAMISCELLVPPGHAQITLTQIEGEQFDSFGARLRKGSKTVTMEFPEDGNLKVLDIAPGKWDVTIIWRTPDGRDIHFSQGSVEVVSECITEHCIKGYPAVFLWNDPEGDWTENLPEGASVTWKLENEKGAVTELEGDTAWLDEGRYKVTCDIKGPVYDKHGESSVSMMGPSSHTTDVHSTGLSITGLDNIPDVERPAFIVKKDGIKVDTSFRNGMIPLRAGTYELITEFTARAGEKEAKYTYADSVTVGETGGEHEARYAPHTIHVTNWDEQVPGLQEKMMLGVKDVFTINASFVKAWLPEGTWKAVLEVPYGGMEKEITVSSSLEGGRTVFTYEHPTHEFQLSLTDSSGNDVRFRVSADGQYIRPGGKYWSFVSYAGEHELSIKSDAEIPYFTNEIVLNIVLDEPWQKDITGTTVVMAVPEGFDVLGTEGCFTLRIVEDGSTLETTARIGENTWLPEGTYEATYWDTAGDLLEARYKIEGTLTVAADGTYEFDTSGGEGLVDLGVKGSADISLYASHMSDFRPVLVNGEDTFEGKDEGDGKWSFRRVPLGSWEIHIIRTIRGEEKDITGPVGYMVHMTDSERVETTLVNDGFPIEGLELSDSLKLTLNGDTVGGAVLESVEVDPWLIAGHYQVVGEGYDKDGKIERRAEGDFTLGADGWSSILEAIEGGWLDIKAQESLKDFTFEKVVVPNDIPLYILKPGKNWLPKGHYDVKIWINGVENHIEESFDIVPGETVITLSGVVVTAEDVFPGLPRNDDIRLEEIKELVSGENRIAIKGKTWLRPGTYEVNYVLTDNVNAEVPIRKSDAGRWTVTENSITADVPFSYDTSKEKVTVTVEDAPAWSATFSRDGAEIPVAYQGDRVYLEKGSWTMDVKVHETETAPGSGSSTVIGETSHTFVVENGPVDINIAGKKLEQIPYFGQKKVPESSSETLVVAYEACKDGIVTVTDFSLPTWWGAGTYDVEYKVWDAAGSNTNSLGGKLVIDDRPRLEMSSNESGTLSIAIPNADTWTATVTGITEPAFNMDITDDFPRLGLPYEGDYEVTIEAVFGDALNHTFTDTVTADGTDKVLTHDGDMISAQVVDPPRLEDGMVEYMHYKTGGFYDPAGPYYAEYFEGDVLVELEYFVIDNSGNEHYRAECTVKRENGIVTATPFEWYPVAKIKGITVTCDEPDTPIYVSIDGHGRRDNSNGKHEFKVDPEAALLISVKQEFGEEEPTYSAHRIYPIVDIDGDKLIRGKTYGENSAEERLIYKKMPSYTLVKKTVDLPPDKPAEKGPDETETLTLMQGNHICERHDAASPIYLLEGRDYILKYEYASGDVVIGQAICEITWNGTGFDHGPFEYVHVVI